VSVPRILVIEDDDVLGPSITHRLRLEGFMPVLATRASEARARMGRERFDALVSDIRLPDGDGESLYRRAMVHLGDTPILFVTAFGDIEQAVRLMKAGANDYLTKPFDMAGLVGKLGALVRRRTGGQDGKAGQPSMVVESAALRRIDQQLARLARTTAPVLLRGETGSGKEVVARRLHGLTERSPFVAVNCAAIPPELAESTLFGHERGAFTGATARHVGYFEEAGSGTLFLDEIAELGPGLQAKLLRVIQERVFRRVGGTADLPFHARLVTATNADLRARVAEKSFREDLLFRIAVVELEIPPLRERPEDMIALFHTFVATSAAEYGMPVPAIASDLEPVLRAHGWPGNARELRNRVARAVALADGASISVHDVFPERDLDPPSAAGTEMATLEAARDDAERQAIAAALRAAGGKVAAAAASLGISRVTLWSKMRRLGLGR
jgi:DNA-binding NtrC family response regulator